MSSFLDRLKKKDVIPSSSDDKKEEKIEAQNEASPPADDISNTAEQLKVDILQTNDAILIYAQLAGSNVDDYSVLIDGDGDVIVIKGERNRPTGEHFDQLGEENVDHVLSECSWGRFYREIILPAEIDAERTEAKMREGVLMLYLPLLQHRSDKGVRVEVTQL